MLTLTTTSRCQGLSGYVSLTQIEGGSGSYSYTLSYQDGSIQQGGIIRSSQLPLHFDNLYDDPAYTLVVVDEAASQNQGSTSFPITCGTSRPADPDPDPVSPPQLSLLTKDSGYVGDTILLTGKGFTNTTQVRFTGVSTTFFFLDDTQLQARVPSGISSGDVQVVVGDLSSNTLPFTLLEVSLPPVVVDPQPEIPGWTISWQLDFNSWTGEHTTIPTWYLPRNLDTYRVVDKQLVKQTVGTYGLPLTLKGIANWEPLRQKTYDTLVLEQEIRDFSLPQPLLRYTTFTTLSLNTDFHHTGTLTPYVPQSYQDKWSRVLDPTQVAASFEKDQYNLEIPGSVVVDVDKGIADPANWNLTQPFKPRLSGKWAQYNLFFQGTPTQKLVLHTLRILSRLIPR